MTNRWVEYVKKFARDNNLSYGCALSDPNLRKGYVPIGKKAQAKRADEEREKRQDEEEKRVMEEKQVSANQPKNLAEAKTMLKKALKKELKNADLSKLAGLIEIPANKKKKPAKKTATPAKKTATPVGLTDAEMTKLKHLKGALFDLNRMRSMGVYVNEPDRPMIERKIIELQRKLRG